MVVKLAKRRQEMRPIVLGHYTLTATGLDVKGKPDFEEHEGVGEFIKRAQRASGWWLADWLRYGDERKDWAAKIDQAVDATGLNARTVKNVRAIGKLPASRRRDDVEFSTHFVVAGLPPDEQEMWLERAASHGWSERDLRLQVRAARRIKIVEGQAVLEGMYRVIYSDNPWKYGDRPPSGVGQAEHYPGMDIEEQCRLPVASHALPDSVLFMWCTAPIILQNPGPREVAEAWGFTYKQQWIWDKVDGNYGHYSTGNHEILTIWTRGSCLPDNPDDLPDSVVTVRKSRQHSAKPEEFRKLIEKHWTRGPYLELFGRDKVDGWSVFGNDAKLWAEEAAS